MPGYGTNIEAPLLIGVRPTGGINTPSINDYGPAQVTQRTTIVAAGTATVSGTIYVPPGSILIDVTEDTVVAWNSGTAYASVGTAAADTTYAGVTDVHSVGRARPTFTAAQLLNMGSVVTPGALVFTVAPTGTASAGITIFTFEYAPTTQPYYGAT